MGAKKPGQEDEKHDPAEELQAVKEMVLDKGSAWDMGSWSPRSWDSDSSSMPQGWLDLSRAAKGQKLF